MDWGRVLAEHGALMAIGLLLVGVWLLARFFVGRPWRHRPSLRSALTGVLGLAVAASGGLAFRPLWDLRSGMVILYGVIDEARGNPAPELQFVEVPTGEANSLSEFQGLLVILNFWADYCAQCGPELTALSRLQDEFGATGLRVVAVTHGSIHRVEEYFRNRPVNVIKGILTAPDSLAPLWALKNHWLPLTFMIARDGTVVEGHIGSRSEGFFRSRVVSYLEASE